MFDLLKRKLGSILEQGAKSPMTEDDARQAYRGYAPSYDRAVEMADEIVKKRQAQHAAGELPAYSPQSLGESLTTFALTGGIFVGIVAHGVATTVVEHTQFVVQAVPVITRALGEAALEELAAARRRPKG